MDAPTSDDQGTVIELPDVVLKWSSWHKWDDLKRDTRESGIFVPNKKCGVYEARHAHEEPRLTIGKASDLRHRIKQGLVKGMSAHSSGDNIRASEATATILVRWAETDRPAAVEEELHKQHVQRFGRLPKYTAHT